MQLLGQALAAATRTVPAGRAVRSFHAYFLAGALPGPPIDYHVTRIRDGGSVSHRRVLGRQDGREILSFDASFGAGPAGLDHADIPAPGLTADRLPPADGEAAHSWSGIELRFGETESGGERRHTAYRRLWMRCSDPLPADSALHACVLAYASDLTLIRTALVGHDDVAGRIRLASIDHALWLHRPVRADEWLSYESVSPVAHGSRALALGYVHDTAGRLVATVAQEGMARLLGGA
ncbi:acyl-CoA thioesterase domain-containing protein [Streptosporangium sp. NPDC006013]|uniref:acyl-CoA thioesterase n=1 Tax=Streptosporangium sp. NPDC006013 TaxID=3155596 RepID=UPI0033AE15B8